MTAETCVPPPGFPIRRSPDRSLHTAPRSLSQCSTSFIGTWRQGIHRTPFVAYARDAENSTIFRSAIQLLRCACTPPRRAGAGGLAAPLRRPPRGRRSAPWPNLSPTTSDPALSPGRMPAWRFVPVVLFDSTCRALHQSRVSLAFASVEMRGFEPLTSALQRQRSPS